MKFLISGLAALAVLAGASAASAAPVTVNLRVEAPSKTVFEGPVTTDIAPFQFTGDSATHTCNGTKGNGGDSATPQPTRGAAITAASKAAPFSMTGSWNDQFGSPTFATVGGESVAYDSSTGAFFGEYRNWQPSNYGACGEPIANGDDVLFAYGAFGDPLLKLSGPATAAPGQPFTVKVVDGGTGAAIAGASVGGATTGGDGNATLSFADRGDHDLKASKPNTIRSNRIRVCVTDGADGFCGTTAGATGGGQPSGGGASSSSSSSSAAPFAAFVDRVAPHNRVTGIREHQRFKRGKGPRTLRGLVTDDSGLRAVKLRLTRKRHGDCTAWSAKRERWAEIRCGSQHAWYFTIGTDRDWSYLLPRRLGRGRYQLDVKAVDMAYNRDDVRHRGVNQLVFYVS